MNPSHTRVTSSFNNAIKLFSVDKNGKYYSNKNETSVKKLSRKMLKLYTGISDPVKPPLHSESTYDLLFGSNNATTILQHEIMFRCYFTVLKVKHK